MDEIKIFNLNDMQHQIKHVAKMQYLANNAEKRGRKLSEYEYRVAHSIQGGNSGLPQTHVAMLGDKILGSVSLYHGDLHNRPDLTPWLTWLMTHPDFQRNGVGKMLQEHIKSVAKKLGYPEIYLMTDHENYYERTGWEFIGHAPRNDATMRLYKHNLTLDK